MSGFNYELYKVATWAVNDHAGREEQTKVAFQPIDAAAGGGGMPMPGGDPTGGAMPPMDPSMAAGGMPPATPMAPAPAPIAPAAAPQAAKPAKTDLNTIAMDVFHIKKMILVMAEAMGIQIPTDLLYGPNRDPNTGLPMPAGMPGSTSDPGVQLPGAGGAQGVQPPGAIPPIQPMEGAVLGGQPPAKAASPEPPVWLRSFLSEVNV